MRVITRSLDDFLANLEIVGGEKVFQQVVYASISANPVDGNKRTAVKFDVVFQASAVIVLEEGGDYMLEVGVDCGRDYHDSTQEFAGSAEAQGIMEQLRSFCGARGLSVRPGIVEV